MKIGILTSGGDCAGLNAAIGAVTVNAALKGYQVLGLRGGTRGLMGTEPNFEVLQPAHFTSDVMRSPSTFLGTTNRGNPFAYPMDDGTVVDRSDEIIGNIKKLGIETLIGIGGDGSLDILNQLTRKGGINLMWMPKTIDNDVCETEVAIGFYSAVATAFRFLNDLHATAQTHDMIMVTEIMGRDAGHLALHSGVAAHVDIILIPEIEYAFENLVKKYEQVRASGRSYMQVLVSEAVKTPDGEAVTVAHNTGSVRYGGIGQHLKRKLQEALKVEVRVQSPGHTLRGCSPTAGDIILAQQFGVKVIDLISQKKFGRMAAMQYGSIVDVPVEKVAGRSRPVTASDAMVHTARGLNISLGDQ
ncbi:MAG: ATP-dependent 6-phosphofructokinase [Alphaproteobacteria bacterium]|nr:ATP-dependent 6-phosphofructokinase [Alphaproteobacteria bacterium]